MSRLLLSLLALPFLFAVPAGARERPPRGSAAVAPVDPSSGTERIALDIGGATRRYLLHVPPGAGGPRPLVLVFHGPASQGAVAERQSRFSVLAEEAGFVAAYPEGASGEWQVQQDPRSEITFIRIVIEDIIRRTAIDRRRVFAAGVANGALMAAALGCFAPDAVAAVGLVAGAYVSPCHNQPRAPAILFAADGAPPRSRQRPAMPVRDFAVAWGSVPGCQAAAEPLPSRGAVRVELFACGGAQAVLWTIQAAGPGWPPTPPAPDATREIWRFFAAVR